MSKCDSADCKSTDGHSHSNNCCKSLPNPSVSQNLSEMEFERGIWQAAIDNDVQRLTKLISYQKIDPDSTDNYGYTALHYAVRHSSLDATKCLIKLGANINCETKNNRTTPLHRAIMNDKKENYDIIEFLLKNGANVHLKDIDGFNPLERAKEKQLKNPTSSIAIARIVDLLNQHFTTE